MIHDIKQNFLTPEVYEIYSQCMYAPTYGKFAEKASAYLNSKSTAVYGYYENAALLGVIVLQAKSPNTAALGRYVELYAETDDDAVTFYERCGFEVEAFQAAYDGIPCKRYRCTCHLS